MLDLDGPDALREIQVLAPGYRHPGPVSSTGKGYHLLFAPTGAKNGARLRPGLDFRGINGYIVAPPSIHPNGHAYAWAKDETLPLPEAPQWLDNILFPPLPPRQPTPPTDPKIADALETLDIVTEFRNAGADLRSRGNRYTTRCLFHADDTPSLTIYPETQSFYCFGCGAWGDALNLRKFMRDGALR